MVNHTLFNKAQFMAKVNERGTQTPREVFLRLSQIFRKYGWEATLPSTLDSFPFDFTLTKGSITYRFNVQLRGIIQRFDEVAEFEDGSPPIHLTHYVADDRLEGDEIVIYGYDIEGRGVVTTYYDQNLVSFNRLMKSV